LSGIFYAALYIVIVQAFGNSDKNDNKFVAWFLMALVVNLLLVFFISSKYIENWLEKKDDLTGETDALRELTGHDGAGDEKKEVFKKIRSLFFCLILCYSITLSCYPVLTLTVGKNWLSPDKENIKPAFITGLYNIFDFIGKLAFRWIKIKDGITVYVFSIARITLILGYIIASDPDRSKFNEKNLWFGYALLGTLGISNGYFTTASFVFASTKCEDRSKKTSGYMMTVSLFLGLTYGGLIAAMCLENKDVPV
jgi:uncharacterized protein YneF (UPF0154 family)